MLAAALLALGLVSTSGGGALAVSGLSAQGTAAQAQYPIVQPSSSATAAPTTPSLGGTAGDGVAADEVAQTDTGDDGGVRSDEAESAETAPTAAQAARQVAASGAEGGLPVTGYLAIPVLLLGLLSLGAGVVLRVRLRRAAD
jgi:hypothetical protein